MLKIAKYLNFKEIDFAELASEAGFFEIFIYLFAKNLYKLLKIKQNKCYIIRYDELKFVKEKIDMKKYCINPAKYHRIPCIYHELSKNTLINKILKFSIAKMVRITENRDVFRLLNRINSILEPVDSIQINLNLIEQIRYHRLNTEFKPFIEFCKIFLQNFTLTMREAKIRFFSLLIPMEKLFEKFIGEVLKKNHNLIPKDFKSKPIIQKSIGFLARKDKDEFFKLIPDVYLKNDKKAIIDTKYKLLDMEDKKYNVSQSDIYQMYAYCKESGSSKCLLIYPEGLNVKIEKAKWKLGISEDIDLFVRTISLTHDLTSNTGWENFKKDFKKVLSCLNF